MSSNAGNAGVGARMKPSFKIAAYQGKDICNPQLIMVRDMVMQQALQTMLFYGVAKLEMHDTHLGHTKVLSPKATDLKVEGITRPKALSATRNAVFTHWSQILYMYGITEVEANPDESELENMKKLWTQMNSVSQ